MFGTMDDAHTELCFWKACAHLFGGLSGRQLSDAVRTNARMNSIDADRTAYLADRL